MYLARLPSQAAQFGPLSLRRAPLVQVDLAALRLERGAARPGAVCFSPERQRRPLLSQISRRASAKTATAIIQRRPQLNPSRPVRAKPNSAASSCERPTLSGRFIGPHLLALRPPPPPPPEWMGGFRFARANSPTRARFRTNLGPFVWGRRVVFVFRRPQTFSISTQT